MLVAAVVLLLLYGSVGMLLSARLASPPTGPAFWRLVLLLILSGLGLGLGLRATGLGEALPAAGAVVWGAYGVSILALVIFGVQLAFRDRSGGPALDVATLAALTGLLLDPVLLPTDRPPVETAVYGLGMITVATSLGSVLLAMVLAHWYLIEPSLPIEPLKRVLALFIGTEVVKAALLAAVVVIHWPEWASAPGGVLRAFVLGDALFVGVRAFLGVAAPIGLGWMTWKTVEIRSIQSATGILYAAIVFVLFGEVISLFLQLSTGRPF